MLTPTERFCRLLAPGELTECLQWALPRYPVERAAWILSQLSGLVELGQTSQIVAAVASRGPSHRVQRDSLLAAAVAIPQLAGAATLLLLQALPGDTPAQRPQATQTSDGQLNGGKQEDERSDERPEVIGHLLEPVLDRLRELGVTFLQAACDDPAQGALLKMAGFQPLADLSLMVLPCERFAAAIRLADAEEEKRAGDAAAAQWLSLDAIGEDWPEIFSCVATETFIQTRDCPLLSEFRTAEDIVRGYRAASTFDPALSRLLRVGDQWAGCLVLTRHHGQPSGDATASVPQPAAALELTYMGLVPEYRRRRLSASLLAETVRVAAGVGAAQVVLAVDQANGPATASYRRLGWRDIAWESVWGRQV